MNEVISALSVLLVFMLILYNFVRLDIARNLALHKPSAKESIARRKYIKKIRFTLMKSLGINLVFLTVSFILYPDAREIIQASQLNLVEFDTLNTIYVLIEFGLIGLLIYGLATTGQIVKRLYEK